MSGRALEKKAFAVYGSRTRNVRPRTQEAPVKLRQFALVTVLSSGALSTALGLGCAGHKTTTTESGLSSDESALLADGNDGAQAGDTASAIVSVPLLPITKAELVANADAAATAAATSGTFFQPAGCVTATRAANVITYVFAGCTGPFGLVAVNGKITATITAGTAPSSVDVAVKSEGLTLNKAAVEQSATAHVSWTGTTRTVQWDGQYHGATTGGRPIDHTASYTSSVDSATSCVTLSGTGTTTVGGRGLKNLVTDYTRCGDRSVCPKSGEIISTIQGGLLDGKSIKVEFVGGNHADVTGFFGHVYHVVLACTAG
jgi:hypothetical protein